MSDSPFFSVLVPTYNQSQYLSAALDSILAQTNPNWEAIIINDGSTDATPEILEIYRAKDSRFKVIHKENGGVGSALNIGLQLAQGKWICWLSSDDLFDSQKLEINQTWIEKFPNCCFFFSHFKYLENSTGIITEPPLWRTIPDSKWQVIEMLRATYIHGNSICVSRESWEKVGKFDEELRYGQDYDMWLRLLASYPAVFIPERTCITRFHALQGSNIFREACFFDSAKAAINFLNEHSFSQLFPSVDLTENKSGLTALKKALDIAGQPNSFLYAVGPHPALIWRIMEWAWSNPNPQISLAAKKMIQKKAKQIHKKPNNFAFLWKLINLLFQISPAKFNYQFVDFNVISAINYYWLKSQHRNEAETLYDYLDKFATCSLSPVPLDSQTEIKEILFVFQKGAIVNDVIKYGCLRATIEVAKYLQRSGSMVVLTGLSDQSMGFTEGLLFIGASTEAELQKALLYLKFVDTLIQISRADFIFKLSANHSLIYHHGPHPPIDTFSIVKINISKTSMICVSDSSRKQQINFGITSDLIHVVPNAYDSSIFYPNNNQSRDPHTIIFAGHIVDYKGIDIALMAFVKIKEFFSDAVFYIAGQNCSWHNVSDHYLLPEWLDFEGFPIWSKIQQDIPGIKYCGELSQSQLSELFQRTSLLIIPSRIAETFGLVSLEAQSCGCIPLLPRIGGFIETVKPETTGYLYNENTPENIAHQVISLWNQGLPRDEQRIDAQTWVRENFSWEKTGSAFWEILKSMPSPRQLFMFKELVCAIDKIKELLKQTKTKNITKIFIKKIKSILEKP